MNLVPYFLILVTIPFKCTNVSAFLHHPTSRGLHQTQLCNPTTGTTIRHAGIVFSTRGTCNVLTKQTRAHKSRLLGRKSGSEKEIDSTMKRNSVFQEKILLGLILTGLFITTSSNPLNFQAASRTTTMELGSKLSLLMGCFIPMFIASMGLVVPMVFLEWFIRVPRFQKRLITYSGARTRFPGGSDTTKGGMPSHHHLIETTIKKIAILSVGGGFMLYNLKLPMFHPDRLMAIPGIGQFVREFGVMFVLVDFLLWLVHFALHKNEFLWEHVHAVHHSVRLPTPLTTAYASFADSALNGAMPLIVGAAVVNPSPWVFYAILSFFVPHFVLIHSGIDNSKIPFLVRILNLGFLPYRVGTNFHDRHHKMSGKEATDLGTMLSFWDFLFGTLSLKSKREVGLLIWLRPWQRRLEKTS